MGTYTISSDEKLKITLCENNTVKSVLQNVAVLISTQKGTVPFYREFGINMDYIDKPVNVVESLLMSELSEAIEEYEPRAKILDLRIESSKSVPGKIAVILKVGVEE